MTGAFAPILGTVHAGNNLKCCIGNGFAFGSGVAGQLVADFLFECGRWDRQSLERSIAKILSAPQQLASSQRVSFSPERAQSLLKGLVLADESRRGIHPYHLVVELDEESKSAVSYCELTVLAVPSS